MYDRMPLVRIELGEVQYKLDAVVADLKKVGVPSFGPFPHVMPSASHPLLSASILSMPVADRNIGAIKVQPALLQKDTSFQSFERSMHGKNSSQGRGGYAADETCGSLRRPIRSPRGRQAFGVKRESRSEVDGMGV
jgi:hypothetical protein